MRKSCEHYVTADNYVSAAPFLQKHYNNKMYNRYQVRAFFQHEVLPQEWAEQNSHRQLFCKVCYIHTRDDRTLVSSITIVDANDGEIVEYWDYHIPQYVGYYHHQACTFNKNNV